MTTLVVIAKECAPGRVKTRLHPPLSLEDAAGLAAVSLAETLDAARIVPAARHILYFDGRPPEDALDFEIVQQPEGSLDERLAAIFDRTTDRTLLIGMDTPQVDPTVLASALVDTDADAWFGPALDGGFWAIGLDRPRGDLLRGVPMSRSDTGARQLRRLDVAGLTVRHLPELVDVDTIGSALAVAEAAPGSRFAAAFAEVAQRACARADRP